MANEIFISRSEKGVTLSAYSADDELNFERYHVDLVEEDRTSAQNQSSLFSIIGNILRHAGVKVVEE